MVAKHREIRLTKGLSALVDAADFDWLSQWNWCANQGRYAVRQSHREDRADGKRGFIHMHREILAPPVGMYVDHVNGDGLDNRRANLRVCTRQQNAQNGRGDLRADKLRGAFAIKDRWQAIIIANGHRHYLGTFRTQEEAARVYDAAARQLHGDFAVLNFGDAA
jgi:hypothetical protein